MTDGEGLYARLYFDAFSSVYYFSTFFVVLVQI